MHSLLKIVPALKIQRHVGEVIIITKYTNIVAVLTILKKHISYQYKLLSCISGVDLALKSYRFVIAYDLLNPNTASRIRVKTFLNELNSILTVERVFYNATWWEREIWDMFGIKFLESSDPRRILTDYGFHGHPLRKDFPLSGYVEVFYDERKNRINTQSVRLSQKYRSFGFKSPWE
jgi:NADH:ubiquinone oxidoreductase subunit C